MDNNSLEIIFKNSPTLKLLKNRNAALVLSFLYLAYKEKSIISISQEILVQKLADYLEDLNFYDDEETLSTIGMDSYERAKKHVENWTEQNWLRNYVDENSKEVTYVLTKHTQKAFQALEVLKEKSFVGTESKFRDLFQKLNDLIENTIENKEKKIEELEKKRKAIDDEIRKIQIEQTVKTYENYQVKSRFDEINRLANELIGDFSEVEDNFRGITRRIYEQQAMKDVTKGRILHYTFDALDELKQSEQGKSFYSFWSFLIDDESQEELKFLINELYKILLDRGIEVNDKYLRKLKSLLHNAGRKVLDSNDVLADKLSRVVSEKDLAERKRVRETINEIRNVALKLVETSSETNCTLTIEWDPYIDIPTERKLGEESIIAVFENQPKTTNRKIDLVELSKAFDPNRVNKKQLHKNIHSLLADRDTITLSEVLEKFPITKGLAEIMGYFSLVETSVKYFINDEVIEHLLFDVVNSKFLIAPQIIFSK